MDMLQKIFELQGRLDAEITEKRNIDKLPTERIQMNALAIISELSEVLDEVNFKWWKNPKEVDHDALVEEIVDVMHFLVGMFIYAGADAEEVFRVYMSKHQENVNRQRGLSSKAGYEVGR